MNKKIKFNGMDLFIVIMIAAVIAVGVYLLTGTDGGSSAGGSAAKDATVSFTVELSAREQAFTELVKEGDLVLVGEKDKVETKVTGVEIVPAKSNGYDIIGGRVLNSEIPDAYDTRITLEAGGTETDSDITVGEMTVKIGQGVAISSKNWTGYGYVIGLETDNAE